MLSSISVFYSCGEYSENTCAESKRPIVHSRIVQSPCVQTSRVQASRVQASNRPESMRPGVQSPSVQVSRVQTSRVQVSRRPESKRPESKCPRIQSPSVQSPGVRSPDVQTMRPETSFSGMPEFLELRIRNFQDFRVLLLYEHKPIGRFSNLHECTFKKSHLSEKYVEVEEELDYIDIDIIENLEHSPRPVVIDEECGNLIVGNDGGELTRNISQKNLDVSQ